MNPWRSMIVAVTLLLGGALAIAWPAGPVSAADDVPLADRLFRVEWTAGASGQGQTRIIGYVYNESDHDAANVQLRISALDASGRTVRSVIKPIGDPVPAKGRAFFDLQVPNTSPSYQLEVESFGYIDNPWTTQRTEHLLAAAGFEMKLADTPEKLANLSTMTPRRTLVPQTRQPAVLRLCRPRSLQMPVCGDLHAVRTGTSDELRERPVDCCRGATERPPLGPLGTLALVLGFATRCSGDLPNPGGGFRQNGGSVRYLTEAADHVTFRPDPHSQRSTPFCCIAGG